MLRSVTERRARFKIGGSGSDRGHSPEAQAYAAAHPAGGQSQAVRPRKAMRVRLRARDEAASTALPRAEAGN